MTATNVRTPDKRERNVFAQMSNARALFNAHIAEILGVRYAAGLARVPILGLVESDTREALAALLRQPPAAEVLQRAYGVGATLCARDQPDALIFPFFAAEVFQQASTPSDIPGVLDTVRNKCQPLRDRFVELNSALQAGDTRAVQEIHASLGPVATESVWGKVGLGARMAVAAADFMLAWLEPFRVGLNIVVALLGPLLDPDMRKTILGQSRVHYGLVGDMRPLVDSADALIRLWRPRDPDTWRARLETAAELGVTSQP